MSMDKAQLVIGRDPVPKDGQELMKRSFETEIMGLSLELEMIRQAIARRSPEPDPWRRQLLDFWMESARFRITELEILDQEGEVESCKETLIKAQQCIGRLHRLLR